MTVPRDGRDMGGEEGEGVGGWEDVPLLLGSWVVS
jgi:hypothetical protein